MKDHYKVYSRYLEEDEVGKEWEKFDRNRKIYVWERAYIFDRELDIPNEPDVGHIPLKNRITNIENVLEIGYGNKLSITVHYNSDPGAIYFQPDYSEFLTVGKGLRIGNNNTIHSTVSICDNVKIKDDNCIYGHARLGNNVSIGSHCGISPYSLIDDDVTIGNHVAINCFHVGKNCQFGNYVTTGIGNIGSNCKIGIGKDIMGKEEITNLYGRRKPCLNETKLGSAHKIGNNVTIGKNVRFYGWGEVTVGDGATINNNCVIWSDVSIGTDAVINNNCTIGPHVRIGANAVIEAGTKVPSGATIEPGAVVNSKTFA